MSRLEVEQDAGDNITDYKAELQELTVLRVEQQPVTFRADTHF